MSSRDCKKKELQTTGSSYQRFRPVINWPWQIDLHFAQSSMNAWRQSDKCISYFGNSDLVCEISASTAQWFDLRHFCIKNSDLVCDISASTAQLWQFYATVVTDLLWKCLEKSWTLRFWLTLPSPFSSYVQFTQWFTYFTNLSREKKISLMYECNMEDNQDMRISLDSRHSKYLTFWPKWLFLQWVHFRNQNYHTQSADLSYLLIWLTLHRNETWNWLSRWGMLN